MTQIEITDWSYWASARSSDWARARAWAWARAGDDRNYKLLDIGDLIHDSN